MNFTRSTLPVKNKLGVIVPFRNRSKHLSIFIPAIVKNLSLSSIDYEIIIVEQLDDKPFNRGKLLNIGFQKAKELDCNYVVFHDIDMIPIEVNYGYSRYPLHLASNVLDELNTPRFTFDEYFGGITLFPVVDFEKVNGYSNNYWGWGFEDDDLLYRCILNNIKLKSEFVKEFPSNTAGYLFNGFDSSISIPNSNKLDNYTIFFSVTPKDINCSSERESDEYSIFTIPGFDTSLSFNSFKRFKFETWTSGKDMLVLNSNIIQEKRTLVFITHDKNKKLVTMYIDGIRTDEIRYSGRLLTYSDVNTFIIGQPTPDDKSKRPFRGIIDYFAIWDHSLEPGQIGSIVNNLTLGLQENFTGYSNAHSLRCCYDMKIGTNKEVIDLTKNQNIGKVYNCSKININLKNKPKRIHIPYRRNSIILHLEHANNGFYKNRWKYKETRKNQLKFYNQVKKGLISFVNDGLSTLKFDLVQENKIENYHKISVNL